MGRGPATTYMLDHENMNVKSTTPVCPEHLLELYLRDHLSVNQVLRLGSWSHRIVEGPHGLYTEAWSDNGKYITWPGSNQEVESFDWQC